MSKRLLFIPSVVAVGLMILSSPALAQQKSVAACQQEWRANKAANQAAGVTEKAFVEKCRAGPAAAQSTPTTVPSAKPAKSTTPPSTAAKPTKTAKACESEWRANKAANQAAGITEKAYVEKCRAGVGATQPAPAPTAKTPPSSKPKTTAAPAARAPAAAGQFSTEAQAKARCPGDTVVLEGTPTLVTDRGEVQLTPGMCAGFPAAGLAHQLVNRTGEDVVYLEIGDRTPGDEATYPADDIGAKLGPDGKWAFTRKDGMPY